jgi:hypothetical protein
VDFDLAIDNITSRVKEIGYGCMFTLDELQEWLKIAIKNDGKIHNFEDYERQQKELCKGFELDGVIQMLNNQLVLEHNIVLRVENQCFNVAIPTKADLIYASLKGAH